MAALLRKLEQEQELGLRDEMKQRLTEYSVAVRGGQTTFLDDCVEEKSVQRRKLKCGIAFKLLVIFTLGLSGFFPFSATEDLQISKEESEVSVGNKTLALQRIQLMSSLRNTVNQDDEDSGGILETVNHIVFLSQSIIHYQQQAHEKKEKLFDIKRKRLSLKKDERRKLQQIQAMKKKQKKEKGNMNLVEKKLLQNIEKERDMTTVIQNVFQNIIIGSGVNWAEDPSLKAVILQLEKNVCLP
ncbi:centromere protein H [Empidonax traillii]|uniref:centromere protein H n=1 Tax=Empidonax traillii TaxID=164674 RepID=UPI000FFD682C|nr:centromere protein H [Empidonax traillii]